MHTYAISLTVDTGAKSQKLAISTVSAQSALYGTTSTGNTLLVTPTVACFVRSGTNPTAVNTGVDMYLLPNNTYRIQVGVGQKLAFISESESGFVYITPEL